MKVRGLRALAAAGQVVASILGPDANASETAMLCKSCRSLISVLFYLTLSIVHYCGAGRNDSRTYAPADPDSTVIYDASARLLRDLFTGYLDSVPRNDTKPSALQVLVNSRILRLLDVDEMRQVLSFSAKFGIVSTFTWCGYDNSLL